MIRRFGLALAAATLLCPSAAARAAEPQIEPAAEDTAAFDSIVKPFLHSYCVACHGPEEQSAERRFDEMTGEIPDDNALVDLQDILDQLNLGEMPPPEADQPSDDERRRIVAWLTDRISRHHEQHRAAAAPTVLRRLNAREYRNTVGDLLQIDMTMFDPTLGFPRDQTADHLDNLGETLVTSGHLLQHYLNAADGIIDKALASQQQPQARTWTFVDDFRQQPEIDQSHRRFTKFEHLTLYEVVGADKHEGAYAPILAFAKGVPHDGIYEIRFHAAALNRDHPYKPELLGIDPEEPFRLGIVPGDAQAGPLHKPQPIEPLLAEIELADDPQWYTVRVRLDAGMTPRFTFRNGPIEARNLYSRLLREHPEMFPKPSRPGIVEARHTVIGFGKLPQINIHEVEIEGPLYEHWPPASRRVLLGDAAGEIGPDSELADDFVRERLERFASRAFRRAAESDEVERLMQLFHHRRESGRSDLDAFADCAKAILCSPNFLYLDASSADGRLSDHALASRLSYFLWSTMPDEQLLRAADRGQLQQDEVLQQQVQRMLTDPRADAFVRDFLDSWLTLRDLGSSPPDRSKFRDYYQYDLLDAMRRETQRFTRHLIDSNLSIDHFLDSDFTFVNRPLARFYGIPLPEGSDFQRVSLSDRRRGGLLGQASVLTVTANGIDTSPVVRGVWLLENILGTPPSPPPPDVEPLDPDVRGATTIREQLQKHRDNTGCYDCHRKIDPLGFALENFDPIGGWRARYGTKTKIDASGELPGGGRFEDVEGFKRLMVERRRQFARALATKLLVYAAGRPMTVSDRPQIDGLVEELDRRGNGMSDLIQLVAASNAVRGTH